MLLSSRLNLKALGSNSAVLPDQRFLEEALIGRATSGCSRSMLVSLVLIVSGCAVGPTYKQPELPIPERFGHEEAASFSAEGVSRSRWWEAFADETLNGLVETSFRNNYDLRVGALRILEARASLGISQSGLFPELAIAGAASVSEGSNHAAAATPRTQNYQIGGDIQWELDFWGRVRRGIESSEATLNATNADFRSLRIMIAAEVANAYIRLRSAERRMTLTKANVRIQAKALSDTRAQFKDGDSTLLDVAQAEAVYADTQALEPALVLDRTNARNVLATLLAVPFAQIEEMVAVGSGLPAIDSSINVGVPIDIVEQRPDIQAAEWRAISAAAEVGVREADRRPSINLAGSLLFQVVSGIPTKAGGASGSSLTDLLSGDSLAYSIMPSIRLPIFDAKRRKNNVRAADARYQSALEQLEQSVLLALQDIDNAMTQVETSKSKAVLLQTSVEAYTKAYETASILYREGEVSFVSVLDSLRQRVSQELNLVGAQSDVALGMVALFKALGGGWQGVGIPILRDDIINEMQQRSDWGDLIGENK